MRGSTISGRVTKVAKRTAEPSKRQRRTLSKLQKRAEKLKARKPNRAVVRRRQRKAEQAALDALPVCPIGRDEIPVGDRIFVSQANLIPGKPHPSTLGRWIKLGVPMRAGATSRLKLPGFRAGSRRWTSLRHFEWWQQQLDAADAA